MSKELDVIMGEKVVYVLPFSILYMFSALWLGPPPCYNVFTFHSILTSTH